jgi:dihydrofolate reductase
MRRIRYLVASSLDGYIAGPNGESDWITPDPEVDFPAIWAQFDTLLMGRKTYEAAIPRLGEKAFAGVKSIVFSRTIHPQNRPAATVVPELSADWVKALKHQSGKDAWLMGGSELFRSFLELGVIDTVEVSVIPVLLGAGAPLLPPPYCPTKLKLSGTKIYGSGRIALTYDIER